MMHYRLFNKARKFCLVFTVSMVFLVQSAPELVSAASDFDIKISSRDRGWDVVVSWHVRQVNIAEVRFTGSTGTALASYPQPYVSNYVFQINNVACGGIPDPLTGVYTFPTRGFANITLHFPRGMFPGVGDFEITSTSACGEDGSVNVIPQPQIAINDVSEIAGSIWQRIDLPELQIKANPLTGLVTVPEWFWLDLLDKKQWWAGTDPAQGGQPFGVTVTIPLPGQAQTVTVLVDAVKVSWDFADNGLKALKSSTLVGKPYPSKSNIQHAYNTADTFKPTVLLRYVPRYAWNSGNWTQLPDLYRESLFTGEIRIKEAQTILVAPDPGTSRQ